MFCLCSLLLFSSARAAEPDRKMIVAQGIGISSCRVFSNMYRDNPQIEDQLFSWAQGFMSGMNFASETSRYVLNAKSIDEEKRHLRRYCDAHPLGEYLDGVLDLVLTLPTVPVAQRQ
jgi:hypothetical protein